MKQFTKCPVCGVSVKTENMSEHTRKAHATDTVGRLDSGDDTRHPITTMTKMDMAACDKIFDKGARFVERKKFKKAIKTLKKIPEDYTDISDVYTLMALSYMGLERFDDAAIYFEKAANAAPWDWQHWSNLANSHLIFGRISKAKKCLDKVNEVGYPSDGKDTVNKLREGIAEFLDAALSDKPHLHADTYLALEDRFYTGLAYMDDRDWDSAIREFEYIASIDPASEKAYGSLGIVHLFKGEFDEAEKCFNRALEINPEYTPASVNVRALDKIRKKAAKDPDYLKKLEGRLIGGHF